MQSHVSKRELCYTKSCEQGFVYTIIKLIVCFLAIFVTVHTLPKCPSMLTLYKVSSFQGVV